MADYWISEDWKARVKTLEGYLRDSIAENKIDHVIRAQLNEAGDVQFYIHPMNADGETLDYKVADNCLWPAHEAFNKPDTKLGLFLVREGQLFTADAMTWYISMLEKLRQAVEQKNQSEVESILCEIRESENED